MTFWIIRAGWEYPVTASFSARGGVLLPMKLHTSSLGNISLPAPGFNASFGGGYNWKRLAVDLALYGDPGQSYVSHQAKIGMMFTLSLSY